MAPGAAFGAGAAPGLVLAAGALVPVANEAWVDLAAAPGAILALGLCEGDVLETAHLDTASGHWAFTALWRVRYIDPVTAGGVFVLAESGGASNEAAAQQLQRLYPKRPGDIHAAIASGEMANVSGFVHLCRQVHTHCGEALPNARATMHSHMVRKRTPATLTEAWATEIVKPAGGSGSPGAAVVDAKAGQPEAGMPSWLPQHAPVLDAGRRAGSSAAASSSQGADFGSAGTAEDQQVFGVALRDRDAIGEMARTRAGELYAKALLAIGKFMPISALAGANSKLPVASFVAYLLQVLLPNARQRLSARTQGELRSVAEALDELGKDEEGQTISEAKARVADQLAQRFKALELEGSADGAVAEHLLLGPKRDYGLATDAELEIAVTKKIRDSRYAKACRADL